MSDLLLWATCVKGQIRTMSRPDSQKTALDAVLVLVSIWLWVYWDPFVLHDRGVVFFEQDSDLMTLKVL